MNKKSNVYVCDFETNNNPDNCRVWAVGVINVYDLNEFLLFDDIDDFFGWVQGLTKSKLYFHNLKFDGEFILSYLFDNGFEYVEDKKEMVNDTFTTLISDMGLFYNISICFDRDELKRNKKIMTNIYDSLKILPFTVKQIAKAFNLEVKKGEIDYNLDRPKNHIITEEEKEYIYNDVYIVAVALKVLFDEDLTKMTQGSNAINDCKEIVGKDKFYKYFPPPSVENDEDLRQAYRGGVVMLNPKYKGKTVKNGKVYDENSVYPYVMENELLPYGDGVFKTGELKANKVFPLFVQKILVHFELKEGYFPTIQLKNSLKFIPTEFIESSKGEALTLYLTNIDLELFKEHYHIIDIEYINGWLFRGAKGVLSPYLQKWFTRKVIAEKEGNKGLRTLSKLMLNAVYGKFASQPKGRSKIPYLDENEIVKYKMGDEEERKTIYIIFAVFITSYARNYLLKAAQSNYDRFIYGDTDSIHLEGLEEPKGIEIDKYKLGAWKHEYDFIKGKFLRAKTYIEEYETDLKEYENYIDEEPKHKNLYRFEGDKVFKLKVVCAGLPMASYGQVTFENFYYNMEYTEKLRPKRVKGGVILEETSFKIKV